MTIQALFRLLLRWWWLFVIGAALGVAFGYFVLTSTGAAAPITLETYSATAAVTVGAEVQGMEQSNTDLNLAESLVPTYVELAKRPPITDRVADLLNLPYSAVELVASHLEVEQAEGTQLIEITGKDTDPAIAAAIANEVARQLQATAPVRPTRLIQIVSMAGTPQTPSTEPFLILAISGIVGLLLALGPVLLVEFTLDRPYTPEWAASRINIPILGTYNYKKTPGRVNLLGRRRSPTDLPDEPVWWTVMRSCPAEGGDGSPAGGHSIAVTASRAKQSRDSAAMNLAHASALSGQSTIIVDADLEHSRLRKWFHSQSLDGVARLATSDYSAEELDALLVSGGLENLSLLPAGKLAGAPGRLLQSAFWQNLLRELAGRADLVIINSPAVKQAPEAMPVVSAADCVLLTMDLGKTRAPHINEAQSTLEQAGVKTLGVVLNTK